jgi:hypothetical protein
MFRCLEFIFVHFVAKYIFTSNAGCSENFSSFFRFIRVGLLDFLIWILFGIWVLGFGIFFPLLENQIAFIQVG